MLNLPICKSRPMPNRKDKTPIFMVMLNGRWISSVKRSVSAHPFYIQNLMSPHVSPHVGHDIVVGSSSIKTIHVCQEVSMRTMLFILPGTDEWGDVNVKATGKVYQKIMEKTFHCTPIKLHLPLSPLYCYSQTKA